MKLLTKELIARIPPTLTQSNGAMANLTFYARLFCPWSAWDWYIAEMDNEDYCFGLVNGIEVELGYFSVEELKEIVGPGGLRIERDMYFEEIKYPELMRQIKKSRNE